MITPSRSAGTGVSLRWDGGQTPEVEDAGPVTKRIRQALVDIQYGRAEDTHAWMHRVC